MTEQLLLSVSQTATRLGVSVPTIRRWIREGTLVAYKPGGRVLVKAADVDAMLEASRICPVVAPLPPPPRSRPAPAAGGLRELLQCRVSTGLTGSSVLDRHCARDG